MFKRPVFWIVFIAVCAASTLFAYTYFDRAFPLISVSAIVVIIGIIIGLNREKMADTTVLLALAVILHNLGGMALGYYIARIFRCPPAVCRTLAIEVGMQNSGLAVALGLKYFSAAAALPGALFSIWHNLAGSALAARWSRRRPPGELSGWNR